MELDLSYLEKKSHEIFNELRNDEQAGFYSGLLVLMVILFLGVVLFHFIKFDFSIKLTICVVVLFLMLILYKLKMQTSYKHSMSLKNYESHQGEDDTLYYTGYLNFLESGVEIKKARTQSVKNLYIFAFPFFLYLLAEVYHGAFDTKSSIFALIIGFILSWITWTRVFNLEMDEWDDLENEINVLKRKLFS